MRGAYWSGHFNQLPNRGEGWDGVASVWSVKMGCGRWYLFLWAGRGGAGKDLRREGGDKEVRNSWLCILHEGEDSTANQMTAVHCDKKADTLSLLGVWESQTDLGSRAPQCPHSRALFSDWKKPSWRVIKHALCLFDTFCQLVCLVHWTRWHWAHLLCFLAYCAVDTVSQCDLMWDPFHRTNWCQASR